jgi:hypothetical protein
MSQDPKQRMFKGNENDVDNLDGCQYLLELGQWQKDSDKRWGESWFRRNIWKSGTINHHKIFGFDIKSYLSPKILQDSTKHPVYIGPWQYSPTIKKNIRFFAYQPEEGGEIEYQYESKTEENKNIKEKPFSLSGKIAPDRFSLCVVKWTAKYGYNAISEVKSKNPFSKNYLVPTGEIIQTKE